MIDDQNAEAVYAYEITTTNRPDIVKVGACLTDTDTRDRPDGHRTWHLYNATTGDVTAGWSGLLRDRLCAPCFEDSDGRIGRVHGHDGEHGDAGDAPKYVPAWMASVTP